MYVVWVKYVLMTQRRRLYNTLFGGGLMLLNIRCGRITTYVQIAHHKCHLGKPLAFRNPLMAWQANSCSGTTHGADANAIIRVLFRTRFK